MSTIKSAPAHAYIFFLALVALVGIIVLLCTSKTVPDQLWLILGGLITGGLGIAVPAAAVAASKATPVSTSVPDGSAG